MHVPYKFHKEQSLDYLVNPYGSNTILLETVQVQKNN